MLLQPQQAPAKLAGRQPIGPPSAVISSCAAFTERGFKRLVQREAAALPFLAARTHAGLPISFPGTTGVAQAMTGGRMTLPAAA